MKLPKVPSIQAKAYRLFIVTAVAAVAPALKFAKIYGTNWSDSLNSSPSRANALVFPVALTLIVSTSMSGVLMSSIETGIVCWREAGKAELDLTTVRRVAWSSFDRCSGGSSAN